MWFIGVEVEQETSATPPKKIPASAPGARIKFLLKCLLLLCFSFLILSLEGIFHNYSRTQETRTLKGNDKQFELMGVRVVGVDYKIQFSKLKIDS